MSRHPRASEHDRVPDLPRTKRTKLELSAAIAAHPWRSVAIGFAAGAALGIARGSRSSISRSLGSAFGELILTLVRAYAVEGVARQAKSWLDETGRPHAPSSSHS